MPTFSKSMNTIRNAHSIIQDSNPALCIHFQRRYTRSAWGQVNRTDEIMFIVCSTFDFMFHFWVLTVLSCFDFLAFKYFLKKGCLGYFGANLLFTSDNCLFCCFFVSLTLHLRHSSLSYSITFSPAASVIVPTFSVLI